VDEAASESVAEEDPAEGPDVETASEAQTEVEAAQTAAAVVEEGVAVEQQERRALAVWEGYPHQLHLFPRQPRPEHRRPLGWRSG